MQRRDLGDLQKGPLEPYEKKPSGAREDPSAGSRLNNSQCSYRVGNSLYFHQNGKASEGHRTSNGAKLA